MLRPIRLSTGRVLRRCVQHGRVAWVRVSRSCAGLMRRRVGGHGWRLLGAWHVRMAPRVPVHGGCHHVHACAYTATVYTTHTANTSTPTHGAPEWSASK